ncbi:hypothetical protein NKH75_07180 [Mesorhizobium sp. M0984]|uniref:hypothetical protein n=1 Tax=Mesorhizobium sp. M0984 TaxID=2957041 RepID=UPI0033395DE8
MLGSLILQFWPYIVAAIVAGLSAWRIRQSGVNSEQNKQIAGKLAAAEDRLEMDREATAAERLAAGLTDDQARAEASKWAKR